MSCVGAPASTRLHAWLLALPDSSSLTKPQVLLLLLLAVLYDSPNQSPETRLADIVQAAPQSMVPSSTSKMERGGWGAAPFPPNPIHNVASKGVQAKMSVPPRVTSHWSKSGIPTSERYTIPSNPESTYRS